MFCNIGSNILMTTMVIWGNWDDMGCPILMMTMMCQWEFPGAQVKYPVTLPTTIQQLQRRKSYTSVINVCISHTSHIHIQIHISHKAIHQLWSKVWSNPSSRFGGGLKVPEVLWGSGFPSFMKRQI